MTKISNADLQATTGNQAATLAQTVNPATLDQNIQLICRYQKPTIENWGFYECMAWRSSVDDADNQMTPIKYNNTITFRTGFKHFDDDASTTPSMSVSRFDYTYTIVETVDNFASTLLKAGSIAMATWALASL